MDTRKDNNKKEKGAAIRGAKAFIKALELNDGVRISVRAYRYELHTDGTMLRIIRTADRSEVDGTNKTVAEWAKIGRPARLGLIGLRDKKETLREQGDRVIYRLNVISGEAYLSRNGERLTEYPQTIEEWAKIGREVEKPFFDSLNAAREYKNAEAEAKVWADMVLRGIVRPKPEDIGRPVADELEVVDPDQE